MGVAVDNKRVKPVSKGTSQDSNCVKNETHPEGDEKETQQESGGKKSHASTTSFTPFPPAPPTTTRIEYHQHIHSGSP